MPAKSDSKHPKVQALLEEGTLNPEPEKVQDPKFHEGEFFDPRDIVQVKYEMLRRVSVEKASVTGATEEYGVSRPTYYQTKSQLRGGGDRRVGAQEAGPARPAQAAGRSAGSLSKSKWLRASRFERASWPSRSGRNSISMSTRGRSSERLAVKKTVR